MLQKLNPEPKLFVWDDVPDNWKIMNRALQIPDGYPFAGSWMTINPFDQNPWKALKGAPAGKSQTEVVLGGPPKPGFIETHGELPTDSFELRTWKNAHPAFVKAGLPDEYSSNFNLPALLEASEAEATTWGFGPSRPYTNSYGGFVRFPHSKLIDFEVPAWTWLFDADMVGMTYQVQLYRRKKIIPEKWHPGVWDWFRKKAEAGEPT